MERRSHLSEEVWVSFNDTMDQFHKTMNEADKTFRCAGATFSKLDRALDESQKDKRLEIPLTLRNRLLLIRLAFSFAKRVRL